MTLQEMMDNIFKDNLGNTLTRELSIGMQHMLVSAIAQVINTAKLDMKKQHEKVVEDMKQQIQTLECDLDKERQNREQYYMPKPINAVAENSEEHF